MKKGAYGVVYQDVTRNSNLSASAKGLYAYLSSFCGVSDECYPSVDTIIREMRMGKDTYYRHINALVAAGVVEKCQTAGEGGKFGRTIYRLTHEVVISDFPVPQNEDTVYPTTVVRETNNNNNTNSNNKNINKENVKEKIDYQQIADMYNDTCVSFPRLTKLSDARKKAIRARMKQYSVDDFKRLFEMAEGSSFLKGENSRNWSATFDWLLKDSNMAKVLDGNYQDRQSRGEKKEETNPYENWKTPSYLEGIENREPRPDDPFQ